jgi:hypothetical protein
MRSALLDGVDDLRRILKHIEDDRLAEVLPSRGLTGQRTKQLDDLVTTLSNIQSRLRQQALEVPHASIP